MATAAAAAAERVGRPPADSNAPRKRCIRRQGLLVDSMLMRLTGSLPPRSECTIMVMVHPPPDSGARGTMRKPHSITAPRTKPCQATTPRARKVEHETRDIHDTLTNIFTDGKRCWLSAFALLHRSCVSNQAEDSHGADGRPAAKGWKSRAQDLTRCGMIVAQGPCLFGRIHGVIHRAVQQVRRPIFQDAPGRQEREISRGRGPHWLVTPVTRAVALRAIELQGPQRRSREKDTRVNLQSVYSQRGLPREHRNRLLGPLYSLAM